MSGDPMKTVSLIIPAYKKGDAIHIFHNGNDRINDAEPINFK